MKKFWEDLKKFALKGNVIDMAVGVVIGSAFGKIVSSFVADIITPLISLITGKVNLTELKLVLRGAETDADGAVTSAEVALTYGNFIQSLLDFAVIALSIFLCLRIMMSIKNKLVEAKEKLLHEHKEEAKPEEKKVPEDIALLTEIRDLLKKDSDGEE